MTRTTTSPLVVLAIIALLAPVASCFSPSYSYDTPYWCTVQVPQCPDGYECAVDDAAPDPTNPDHRMCKKPGGGTQPGDCLGKDIDPNNTPQQATNLDGALSGHPQGVSMYMLQLCSADDVDYFSFTVTVKKHVVAVIKYDDPADVLDAQLLDPSQATLATATATVGGLQVEADLDPQPTLPYYLVVKAGQGGSIFKYEFAVTFSSI